MKEEDDDHQADDQALLDQLLLEGGDGPMDQVRSVVGSDDLDPLGERRRDLLDLVLDPLDDLQAVFTVPDHDDAAGHIALAVQFSGSTADVGPESDPADVPNEDRSAAFVGPDHDRLDVFEGLDVAEPSNHVLASGKLHNPAAGVVVPFPDGVDYAV